MEKKEALNQKGDKKKMNKIRTSQQEVSLLRNAIKRGVYKELYKKQMITAQQLNELLVQVK